MAADPAGTMSEKVAACRKMQGAARHASLRGATHHRITQGTTGRRRSFMRALLAFLVAVVATAQGARAETLYVTDRVEIVLRDGKGMEHKIVGVARSDDPVEALSTEGEYTFVRLGTGTEGWVLTRYLTASPPKKAVITQLTEEIRQLKKKNEQTRNDLARLADEKREIVTARQSLEKRLQELSAENREIKSGCADFVALRDKHATMIVEMKDAKKTIGDLTAENEQLRENTRLMWFIFGAGAVLSGFAIGMYLQSLRNKKRRSFSF